MCLTSNNKNLYSINKVKGQKDGSVAAFAVEEQTGKLQFLNQQSSEGMGSCYVGLDQSEQFALVANYNAGSASILPINKDGSLSKASSTVQHSGTGPNKDRQEGPHAHYMDSGPDGLILVPDLGIDKVMLYKINSQSKELEAHEPPLYRVISWSRAQAFRFSSLREVVICLE